MAFMAPPAKSPLLPSTQAASEAMVRYADGDASAFAVLHDEIAPRIEGFVRRRTSDASRIDDIVQQTFERIHRARGTFIRGSDVLSWAFKIARNLCLDFGAKGWREHTVDGGEGHDPLAVAVAELADAERVAMARETLARLGQAIRRLPSKQQLALELVRVEGFSMGAAAEHMGITLAGLKTLVFRGGAALRQNLLEGGSSAERTREPFSSLAEEQPHGVT